MNQLPANFRQLVETVGRSYLKGTFTELFPLLSEDCVWESFWRRDAEIGRSAVIAYFTNKAEAMASSGNAPSEAVLVKLRGSLGPEFRAMMNVPGKGWREVRTRQAYLEGKLCLLMTQRLPGETVTTLIDVTPTPDGKIARIDITEPSHYYYDVVSELTREEKTGS